MKCRPAAWDEGGILHPVGWAWRCYAAGRQQQEDQVRVGQGALQVLMDQLFSERHLLFRVPALSVPTDNALLRGGGSRMQFGCYWKAKLPLRRVHRSYLLIVGQDFLYSVHFHVADTAVEAENTQDNNYEHLGSHTEYTLCSTHLFSSWHGMCFCTSIYGGEKDVLSRGSDLIFSVSRYNSLYISSMWMWSAWESFMVTCSSILLSPRMKPSCKNVETETNCNCKDNHKERSGSFTVHWCHSIIPQTIWSLMYKFYYILLMQGIHVLVVPYAEHWKRAT